MEQLVHLPNSDKDRFAHGLGIELIECGPAHAVCELTIGATHLNAADRTHGGVVFSLADAAGASALNAGGVLNLTINSSISILRSTGAGDRLRAVAKVLHCGKKISTCQVEVMHEGTLVATMLAQAARV